MAKPIRLLRNGQLCDPDYLPDTAQPPNRKRPRGPKRLLFTVCAAGGFTAIVAIVYGQPHIAAAALMLNVIATWVCLE